MTQFIYSQVKVYKAAYEQLKHGSYVVDDVVDVAIAVMRSERCLVSEPTGDFDVESISAANVQRMSTVPSSLYTNLSNSHHLSLQELFEMLSLSKLNLLQSEYLVIPLRKNKHWTAVVVSNLALSLYHFESEAPNLGAQGPSCFYVLNSLQGAAIDYETVGHLKRFLTYAFLQQRVCAGKEASVEAFVDAMKVIMLEVPKQVNDEDSGAHVIKNIELLYLWGSVQHFSETVYSHETITQYRQHWVSKFDELAELMPVQLDARSCQKVNKKRVKKKRVSINEQNKRIQKRKRNHVKKYPGYVLVEVEGDGNCATRSALRAAGIKDNDQNVLIYKQQVDHILRTEPYREKILFEFDQCSTMTEAEKDEKIEQFLDELKEWGAFFPRVAIQALADVLKMPIKVVTFMATEEVSCTNLKLTCYLSMTFFWLCYDQLDNAESAVGSETFTPVDATDALPTATLFCQVFDGQAAHYDAMVERERNIGRTNPRRQLKPKLTSGR